MIEVKKLGVKFQDRKIISDISFEINEGDKIAIIGPSGEGKSVLLKTIIGLLEPFKGNVIIEGLDIHKEDEININRVRNKIGVLFQGGALFDFLNVEDNIAFPLIAHENLTEKEVKMRVDESLEMVGLKGCNKKMPDELSGGMQKRAALARSIVRKPKYMFYDEPTSGLDPILSNVIDDLISHLNETLGMTSLSITHNVESLSKIATKVFLIYNGEIKYSGPPEELKNSNNQYLKQFISGSLIGPINTNR